MIDEKNGETLSSMVGVDLGHKSWQACRFDTAGKHRFLNGTMKIHSIARLAKWLRDDDTVAIETGTASFWFKRVLESKRPCKVLVLNALKLKFIYESLKKTDKEDSLKLARFVASYPERDLPVVQAPSPEYELARKLVSERAELVRQMMQLRNRFYGLCIQAGYTAVKKAEIRNATNMQATLKNLPEAFQQIAQRLVDHCAFLENQKQEVEAACNAAAAEHYEKLDILTSMPGIGQVTALTISAYTQNFQTFSSAGAVSAYAGLVPRIDQSGTIVHRGRIVNRANLYLRSLMVQAAWSLTRCKKDTALKQFYERQALRIGKGKAIIATARKMIETLYVMVRDEQPFNYA